MKKITYIIWASALLLATSCASRRSEPVKGRSFNANRSEVVHGEQLFMIHCQKCHPGGEGGLGIAINSNPAPGFVKRLQMRHGLGVMPAFSKKELSRSDLKDISSYMRAWKHY
ncbi:c-type cytochrome [Dyadobacter sp. MSC1_007]|jgi:mono/diheme cytochrome c family protein|uniref:c-type cytochrome n=1 Tax=Dyadobacter sp. MSC1_007 TaxID=2909264 RepID=UPI002030A9BA|nr:cytochrome c [Dyadobacter sp. MSC1_007]